MGGGGADFPAPMEGPSCIVKSGASEAMESMSSSDMTAEDFGSEISGTRTSFRAGGGSDAGSRSRTFATETEDVGRESLPPLLSLIHISEPTRPY